MVANSPIFFFRHGELKDNAFALDQLHKFGNRRRFAVQQIIVAKSLNATNNFRFGLYEDCSAMLFHKPVPKFLELPVTFRCIFFEQFYSLARLKHPERKLQVVWVDACPRSARMRQEQRHGSESDARRALHRVRQLHRDQEGRGRVFTACGAMGACG